MKITVGLIIALLGAVLFAASISGVIPQMSIVGINIETYTGEQNIKNVLVGSGFTPSTDMTLNSISAYLRIATLDSPINYKFAIYVNDIFIGETVEGTVSTAESTYSWHSLNLTEPITVTTSNICVLAAWASNPFGVIEVPGYEAWIASTSNSVVGFTDPVTYDGVFPSYEASTFTNTWLIYASTDPVTTGTTPTPTPTDTPSGTNQPHTTPTPTPSVSPTASSNSSVAPTPASTNQFSFKPYGNNFSILALILVAVGLFLHRRETQKNHAK